VPMMETLQRAQPLAQAIVNDDSVVAHVRRASTASQKAWRARRRPSVVPAHKRALQAGAEGVRAVRAAVGAAEAEQRRARRRKRARIALLVVTGLGGAGALAAWQARTPTQREPAEQAA
jgi:hypothetical protein